MPQLQLALDMPDLDEARRIAQAAAASVDIIEAGTPLCLAAGLAAVRALRADHPDKPILADIRIARAGGKLAAMAFAAGADIVSIVAEAPPATARAAAAAARECGGSLQVELGEEEAAAFGGGLARWLELGIAEAIVHSSFEVGGDLWSWTNSASRIRTLAAGGFSVTAAGSVDEQGAAELAGLPVAAAAAGRAICASADPAAAAQHLAAILNSREPASAAGRG